MALLTLCWSWMKFDRADLQYSLTSCHQGWYLMRLQRQKKSHPLPVYICWDLVRVNQMSRITYKLLAIGCDTKWLINVQYHLPTVGDGWWMTWDVYLADKMIVAFTFWCTWNNMWDSDKCFTHRLFCNRWHYISEDIALSLTCCQSLGKFAAFKLSCSATHILLIIECDEIHAEKNV